MGDFPMKISAWQICEISLSTRLIYLISRHRVLKAIGTEMEREVWEKHRLIN